MNTTRALLALVVALAVALFVSACNGRPDAPDPASPGAAGGATAGVGEEQGVAGPLGTLRWSPDVEALLAETVEEEAVLADAEMAPAEELAELGYTGGGGGGGGFAGPGDTVPPPPASAAPSTPAGNVSDFDLGGVADFEAEPAEGRAPETWKPAGAPVNATTLRVGDEDELPLVGVEASVWVDGFRARVLLDCVYRNDREQRLEGTFKLRLPEGATPYYLAFGQEVWERNTEWVLPARDRSLSRGPAPESVLADRDAHWGGAREARLVPRAEAGRAYVETVRAEVDPALMEWAGAGVFQARVFPLESGAVHRVVVGYEVDLVAIGDQHEFALDLPLEVPLLSLDLHVLAAGEDEPQVEPAATPVRDGARRTYSYPSTDARSFRVRMHGLDATALVSDEDGGYFAMDLAPELDASPQAGAPTAIFLVDTSLSSAGGRYPLWLDLTEAVLEENRAVLTDFAVLFFDVAPRWWRTELTPNVPGALEELRAYAERLALEGASDLGAALSEAAHPGWLAGWAGAPWDVFLLSDAAATWGVQDGGALAAALEGGSAGSLFAYATGEAGTDRRVLQQLARESGGALFAVTGPSEVASAATAHRGRPWRIEGLRVAGGSDLLLRGRPTSLFPGQRLRLVGRGVPRAGGAVELELSMGARRETLRLPIERVLATPLAARTYGEVATAQLEELGSATAAEARAFATRFRVPGKACSLLMLESEEDYARWGLLSDDEADLARHTEAAPRVAAAVAEEAGVRADPARAFLERLAPLERAAPATSEDDPEVFGQSSAESSGALDPELAEALLRLPPAAFELAPERLSFTLLESDRVPATVSEALASGEPAYDLLQDEAARRRAEHEAGDAVRILSCLVELNPGDGVFARDVAQTLVQWGAFGHAYHLYLRVAEVRPFEPQSYLALARCAEESGRADLALAWYDVALRGEWETRFGDFDRIAAFDFLHLARRIERGEVEADLAGWAARRAGEIEEHLGFAEADLAIAIQWNTDGTDVDLHVLEPGGEHCYYSERETTQGGRLSEDVTQGYGPELYLLPRAQAGDYTSFVHYFGQDPNRTAVRTKVLATVYQAWGRPEELVLRREILLAEEEEDAGIALLSVRP